MATGTPSIDARARLGSVVAGGAVLVATAGVMALLGGWLSNPMQAAVLGAVVVGVVAGRVGIDAEPPSRRVWARVLPVVLASLGVVAVGLAAALVSGARLAAGAGPSLSTLLATAEWLAVAYRDELWLRGVPWVYSTKADVPDAPRFAFLVATGVAAVTLQKGATPEGLALVAASGAFFAALWLRTRDPWAPVAAHLAWSLSSEVLLGGELADLSQGRLPHGAGAHGPAAIVATAAFAILAMLVLRGWPRIPDEPARDAEAQSGSSAR